MTRHRLRSRLTVWAFAGALLLKSAVPMLASAAATLQGKGVAEVCDVYGVPKLSLVAAAGAHEHAHAHAHGHEHAHRHEQHVGSVLQDHAHGAVAATTLQRHAHAHLTTAASAATPTPDGHGPAHRSAHGGDHCALTGMVALATGAPAFAPRPSARRVELAAVAASAAPHDAAARWATLLEHGPPRRA